MSIENSDFLFPDYADVIQPGDLVFLLSIALGVFVLVQIMNGIVNILTARNMRKHALLQAQVKEDENRLMAEQWEAVIRKFSEIVEISLNNEEKLDYLIENMDDLFPKPEKKPKSRTRGPYGPRKPKVIEHKGE